MKKDLGKESVNRCINQYVKSEYWNLKSEMFQDLRILFGFKDLEKENTEAILQSESRKKKKKFNSV